MGGCVEEECVSRSVIVRICSLDDQIKEVDVGGACSLQKFVKNVVVCMNGDHSGGLDVDGRVILKWIFGK